MSETCRHGAMNTNCGPDRQKTLGAVHARKKKKNIHECAWLMMENKPSRVSKRIAAKEMISIIDTQRYQNSALIVI